MSKNTLMELVGILNGKGPEKYWDAHRGEDGALRVDRSQLADRMLVALDALKDIDSRYSRAALLFGCFCAKHCLPFFEHTFPDDARPRTAIEIVERYAHGLANSEDMLDAHEAILGVVAVMYGTGSGPEMPVIFAARFLAVAPQAGNIPWAVKSAAMHAATAHAAVGYNNATDSESRAIAYNEGEHQAWAVMADEFRRFCALEGEYGIVFGC